MVNHKIFTLLEVISRGKDWPLGWEDVCDAVNAARYHKCFKAVAADVYVF